VIVVCGEALIDMISNGDGTQRAAPGGGPFNTARALARLGVPTAFFGRLSEDVFGRQLAESLLADGVSLELVSIGPESTTIAIADVDSEGLAEYQFLVRGSSAPNLTREMVPEHFSPDVKAIHVGTLGLVLEPMASTLTDLIDREHSQRVVMLDPNIRVGLVPDADYRERLRTAMSQSAIVKASKADLAWLYRNALALVVNRPRKIRRRATFVVRMRHDQENIRLEPLVRRRQRLRLLRANTKR